MRLTALLRWDLVQMARGEAASAAVTGIALGSAGLVGVGILLLSFWSPFTLTPTFGNRNDLSTPSLPGVLSEHRGGVAFLIVMLWLLLVASAVGPAFTVGSIVRDRQNGRLDRILLDTGRADLVAVGKLFGGLLPLLGVLLVAAPATSFAWIIGGISKNDAVAETITLVLLVVLIAATALLCSALARTETVAILASYGAVGLAFWGPLLVSVALAANGLSRLANVVASLDPLVALLASQPDLMGSLTHFVSGDLPDPPVVWTMSHPLTVRAPVWAVDAVLYALTAVILVALSSVALEPLHPLKTWRARRTARRVGA